MKGSLLTSVLINANLIDHKYIERFLSFNVKFMQNFLYIYDQLNLDNEMYDYFNKLLVTINFVTRMCKDIFIYLFIIWMQSCNNNTMTFCM